MESKDLLEQYVTNTDGQVFAVKDLHGIVGAVMARYSRAETGLRETLLREFIKADKLKLKKAGNLIERVLIAYGDDSVGELEGAHLSFENISMLATKVIEHRRIGGSPIEQSTRYIRYDFKDAASGYHYYTPTDLPEDAQTVYRAHMDRIFDAYAHMWQPIFDHLVGQKPMEQATYDFGGQQSAYADMQTPREQSAFQKTWETDIKTKACDILRSFLPLATRANVGLFGNGRFFQNLISKMLTSPLPEANTLGQAAFEELSKVIPHYVKRAAASTYLQDNDAAMRAVVARYFGDLRCDDITDTTLVQPDAAHIAERLQQGVTPEAVTDALREEQNIGLIASLVFSYARGSFAQIRDRVKQLDTFARTAVMDAYYGTRRTRRDRPERGLEHGYPYTFDLVTEWAVYKDLMRHRMATIQVQALVPDLGFVMPRELEDAGLGAMAREAVDVAQALYAWLAANHPGHAEYAVLQGHKIRWLLGMNDRALMHMLELRTAPQGHPNYRLCCRKLHQLVEAAYPDRAARMTFVNKEQIYWSRGDSEARQRVKEAAWEDAQADDAE